MCTFTDTINKVNFEALTDNKITDSSKSSAWVNESINNTSGTMYSTCSNCSAVVLSGKPCPNCSNTKNFKDKVYPAELIDTINRIRLNIFKEDCYALAA